jgi:hypothetical protein
VRTLIGEPRGKAIPRIGDQQLQSAEPGAGQKFVYTMPSGPMTKRLTAPSSDLGWITLIGEPRGKTISSRIGYQPFQSAEPGAGQKFV